MSPRQLRRHKQNEQHKALTDNDYLDSTYLPPVELNLLVASGIATCIAGIFDELCKHKTELLAGYQSMLADTT
jgi:hypothetical protein